MENVKSSSTHIPQIYNGIFESPMTYGMKFSFRLKGESQIQNLWFEHKTIPSFLGYMIRAKMFDWYEWKSTKPMIPTSQKPKAPVTIEAGLYVMVPASKPSFPKDPTKSNNISCYRIEWIWEGESDLNIQVRDSLPQKRVLRQWDNDCQWFKVTEQLKADEPKTKVHIIELTNAALSICHETGIKFASDLDVPVKFHFEMLHPLAMEVNVRALIAKYQQVGIRLESLKPQILAGMLITLLKSHKLYDSNKMTAKVVNEKLVKDCEVNLLALMVKEFYNLRSAIGLPKFDLSLSWYFDKQLSCYLKIIKGEDKTVGTGTTFDGKIESNKPIPSKDEPAMVQAKRIIKELKTSADAEQKLFLAKLDSYLKVWAGISKEVREKLIAQAGERFDLTVKSELLIKSLTMLATMDEEQDNDSDDDEEKEQSFSNLLSKFGKGK